MEVLEKLIARDYSGLRLWNSVQKFSRDKNCDHLLPEFYAAFVPFVSHILLRMKVTYQTADFEEVVAYIASSYVMRFKRLPLSFKCEAHCHRTLCKLVRGDILHYLRISPQNLYSSDFQEWKSSVYCPRSPVDCANSRVLLDELPARIIDFVCSRDRLGIGRPAITLAVHLLHHEKPFKPTLLENWFKVENGEQCLNLIVLLSRLYLRGLIPALECGGDLPVRAVAARRGYRVPSE